MQITQTHAEPRPLCSVVTQLIAAEPSRPHVLEQIATPEVKSAAASPGGSQAGLTRSRKRRRADADDTNSLPAVTHAPGDDEATAGGADEPRNGAAQLPPEACPLASLAAFAAEMSAASQADTAPGAFGRDERRPQRAKKCRQAKGAATDLESLLRATQPRYVVLMPCCVISSLASPCSVLLACC